MTLDAAKLAELRREVDGWRGRFVYLAEHECATCDASDGILGVLFFLTETGDARPDLDDGEINDCATWYIIGEMLDEAPGESLAKLLNGALAMVAEIGR